MTAANNYAKFNYYAQVENFSKVSDALKFFQENYKDLNTEKIKFTTIPETISIVTEKGNLKDLFASRKHNGEILTEHIDLRRERNKDLYDICQN